MLTKRSATSEDEMVNNETTTDCQQRHFQTSSTGQKNGVARRMIVQLSFQYISDICPLSLHLLGTSGQFTPKNSNFNASLLHHCWTDEWKVSLYRVSLICKHHIYALDVFIDKSIAVLLDYSRAVVNDNYTGHSRAY